MTVNSLCTVMFYSIAVTDFRGSAVVDLGNNCLHLMFHIYSLKKLKLLFIHSINIGL